MSTDTIDVSASFTAIDTESEKPLTEDQARSVVNQFAADATYGSFGEFDPALWKDKWEKPRETLVQAELTTRDGKSGSYGITLRFRADLFDTNQGGLQHLLGVLAGDLFDAQIDGITIASLTVEKVDFPGVWAKSLRTQFRDNRAHSIDEIRGSFRLEADQPLLAFSIKPRLGLRFEALEDLALGVLQVGFQLVELDTRNLQLDKDSVTKLLKLASKAASLDGSRVTRFSPNLSIAQQRAVDLCGEFLKCSATPVVVKVDGGLDGVSTCQALRRAFDRGSGEGKAPIITTYPLLRRLLTPRLGEDTFIRSLILSGSDIIYPGGAPSLGGAYRGLDHGKRGGIGKSTDRYFTLMENGFPMLTVAGGIYPGQLQAYYEILGPNVAYFLGGGVALHAAGPIEGAKLCVDVINAARDQRRKAGAGQFAEDFPKKLIGRTEEGYKPPKGLDARLYGYISPRTTLQDPSILRPFFTRS